MSRHRTINDMKILDGLDIEAYIDDLGICTKTSFNKHLSVVDQVLERLAENGMKYNPLKFKWAVKETDFLGYYMNPCGVTLMQNKVDAALKMGAPRKNSEVCSFIGTITFYKSM